MLGLGSHFQAQPSMVEVLSDPFRTGYNYDSTALTTFLPAAAAAHSEFFNDSRTPSPATAEGPSSGEEESHGAQGGKESTWW